MKIIKSNVKINMPTTNISFRNNEMKIENTKSSNRIEIQKKKEKRLNKRKHKMLIWQKVINLVSEILTRNSISHFLCDGSLLGLIRDNAFIPHDSDIDFGVMHDSWKQNDIIIEDFMSNGFRIKKEYGPLDLFHQKKLIYENIFKVDLFFYYNENNKLSHGAWNKVGNKYNLIKYHYEPFNIIKNSQNIPIPEKPEEFLVTKYGTDWKTPIKKWDWKYSPNNHEKTEYYWDGQSQ